MPVSRGNSTSCKIKMKAKDILKHVTGISTPIAGIQWNPPTYDSDVVRDLILFLEDRRVLFEKDEEREGAHFCRQSVEEIRKEVTQALQKVSGPSEIGMTLRSLRTQCRKFCDAIGDPGFDNQPLPVQRSVLKGELEKLRKVAGKLVGALSVSYDLDVEDDLAAIIPLKSR